MADVMTLEMRPQQRVIKKDTIIPGNDESSAALPHEVTVSVQEVETHGGTVYVATIIGYAGHNAQASVSDEAVLMILQQYVGIK